MKRMKGVSAVIVVILLLLISLSIIGFVFVFFQRTASSASGQTEEQQKQLQQGLGKQIRIDNAAGTSIAIRHMGSVALNLTGEVSVYVNNAAASCTWNTGALLQPGGTAICTLASSCTGSSVKITAPGSVLTENCA